VFVEDTVVKAVVVSEIVGRGRPITVTTAAAIPPVVPEKKTVSYFSYRILLFHSKEHVMYDSFHFLLNMFLSSDRHQITMVQTNFELVVHSLHTT
jgi:hypothetical protein